jgi:hypothetical protein
MSPTNQKCANCNAFMMRPDGQTSEGVCRARPPTPLVMEVKVPVQGGLVRGGLQQTQIIQGVFPPMRATSWCREWQAIEGKGQADAAL